MTGISDEYVAEAALVAPVGVVAPVKRKGFASLSPAWRRGLSAACICLIVALAALMGTAFMGRITTTAPDGTPPLARFGFTYEIKNSDGTAMPGDTVYVDTTIINRGLPFLYRGSYAGFKPEACLVLQGNESVIIQSGYEMPTDSGTHTVAMGAEGGGSAEFTIPKDAVPGVYDLVLSYKGTTQVYKGVLTVGDPTGNTKFPEITTDPPFSFGYEPFGGFAIPGDVFTIQAWVINEGAPFTFEGSSMGFTPTAVLIHMETQYRIEGMFDTTTDFVTVTVNMGDKGQVTQEFFIPADAPTGDYALKLSYGGISQTFERVLTVAIPTVIGPAVLYNLTMPIGSDWLYEPIEEVYADGEKVTVRIQFATDVGTLFFLNGEVIVPAAGDDQMGYWEYSFIMPAKDSEIIFQTFDGMAPYSDILQAYYTANPKAKDVLVIDYGTYGDGVRVSIIYDDRFAYAEAEAEHRIGPAVIRYSDGNIMQALYNGTFCSLSKAYETGLLSDADLAALENLHREWNPHLYADDE